MAAAHLVSPLPHTWSLRSAQDQQIEAHAASYAELEKRVGDYPEARTHCLDCSSSLRLPPLQACAALEKQLKFASDRLERADEEKKELQEVYTDPCRYPRMAFFRAYTAGL